MEGVQLMSDREINIILKRYTHAQSLSGHLWLSAHVALQRWIWACLLRGPEIFKRTADILLSSLALVALTPLFALIYILIKMEDQGPVFFIQRRVGQFGREFKLYKFRSMCIDAEQRLKDLLAQNQHKEGITFKLKDDPRITDVGKWLRKFSIDEFPQFFNVLIGDMSLVGPRPPVPREVALYTPADRRRLAVKPGLTCLWQISGRSEIDFSGQVQLDVNYIESQNLWVDVKILAQTVPAVLSGKGAC
jgi:lipopolysaccharide/colanic/teichoic acid biosynthesis glycosyltransferase